MISFPLWNIYYLDTWHPEWILLFLKTNKQKKKTFFSVIFWWDVLNFIFQPMCLGFNLYFSRFPTIFFSLLKVYSFNIFLLHGYSYCSMNIISSVVLRMMFKIFSFSFIVFSPSYFSLIWPSFQRHSPNVWWSLVVCLCLRIMNSKAVWKLWNWEWN